MAAPSAYLSARAAAVRLGVSDKTVRTWVRTGRLSAAPSARGFRIPKDQVETLAADRAADPGAEGPHNSADSAVVPQLRDQVADLRAYVADLRTQLEVKDRQISELHTLLAQSQQQRALAAPREPDPSPGFTGSASANGTTEVAQEPVKTKQRPWWRWW